jgi:hypothetical protein
MHDVNGWPQQVRAHLRRTYGEPSGADQLGGMSLGRVYRVRFPGGSVIIFRWQLAGLWCTNAHKLAVG